MRVLIVGAGLAGLSAGVLLKRNHWDVRVMETRTHFGGNCWDYLYNGVYVHAYGPHIFHTNNERVYKFFSEFCTLTNYMHKVKAVVCDNGIEKLASIPYSKITENQLGRVLTDSDIVEMFFRKYSEKMWSCVYERIPKVIISRVPARRSDCNEFYFVDKYQGMPTGGFAGVFDRMADFIGKNNIYLDVKADTWRGYLDSVDLVVYTGMVDSFYDYEFDRLPYRALKFDFRLDQAVTEFPILNWCTEKKCIRTSDYSLFYDDPRELTVLVDEYSHQWNPCDGLVPSYPMRGFPEADVVISQYENLNPGNKFVFCGRLGAYKYMNMDATIENTLIILEKKLGVQLY